MRRTRPHELPISAYKPEKAPTISFKVADFDSPLVVELPPRCILCTNVCYSTNCPFCKRMRTLIKELRAILNLRKKV